MARAKKTPPKPTAAEQAGDAISRAAHAVGRLTTAMQAIDTCFADLVQNIPALRETEHYNTVVAARDALKSTLKTQEATS